MEEQILYVTKKLNINYILFWIIPFLFLGLWELGVLESGVFADNIQIRYYIETFTILLTALCIPLALKLFNWVLKNKIDKMSIIAALKKYMQWSNIRLGIIEIDVLVSLMSYYLTFSNTGGLCALIGLTASFFCIPGEKRLRCELRIDKD